MKTLLKRLYQRMRYGTGEAGRQRKYARKAAERERRFESERWQRDDFARRRYDSYEDYLAHQAEKLDRIHDRRKAKDEQFAYDEFLRRFSTCAELGESRRVLCLGARLGTEVRALIEHGHFAVGIDLNPGPDNEYVMRGDFHRLVFASGSLDAVYTNALDHVFELERVVAEVARVLRPGGWFIADVLPGFDEGFIPGEYEATHWRTADLLLDEVARLGGLQRLSLRDLGRQGRDRWMQAVLQKPAAG